MCAVIGIQLKNVGNEELEMIQRIFVESSVRGIHATGLSYTKEGKVHTISKPVPAREFLKSFDLQECVQPDKSLSLIGHCRYSTSDLEYNQPIANEYFSIVHNGVVTQELPENWITLYGADGRCKTKNDTELLFNTILTGASPFVWKDASIAACELYFNGNIRVYRNGKRPLHISATENGIVVTSTRDIAVRAQISPREIDETLMCNTIQAGKYYKMWPKQRIIRTSLTEKLYSNKDLQ